MTDTNKQALKPVLNKNGEIEGDLICGFMERFNPTHLSTSMVNDVLKWFLGEVNKRAALQPSKREDYLLNEIKRLEKDRDEMMNKALQPKPSVDRDKLYQDLSDWCDREHLTLNQSGELGNIIELHSQGHLNQGCDDVHGLRIIISKRDPKTNVLERITVMDEENGKLVLLEPPKSEDE